MQNSSRAIWKLWELRHRHFHRIAQLQDHLSLAAARQLSLPSGFLFRPEAPLVRRRKFTLECVTTPSLGQQAIPRAGECSLKTKHRRDENIEPPSFNFLKGAN